MPTKTRIVKSCNMCQKIGKMKRCAGCEIVYYCSSECQRAHWPVHKSDCCLRPDITAARNRFYRMLRDPKIGDNLTLVANELLRNAPKDSSSIMRMSVGAENDILVCSPYTESLLKEEIGEEEVTSGILKCREFMAQRNIERSDYHVMALVIHGSLVAFSSIKKIGRKELMEGIAKAGGMLALRRSLVLSKEM